MENLQPTIPEEIIVSKIYLLRNVKVMLDSDLAHLYHADSRPENRSRCKRLSKNKGTKKGQHICRP